MNENRKDKCSICGTPGHKKTTCPQADVKRAIEILRNNFGSLRATRRIADPNSPVYLRIETLDGQSEVLAELPWIDAVDLSDEIERTALAVSRAQEKVKVS